MHPEPRPLENARRKSFQLPGQRHMFAVFFGASVGATICFIIGFFCLDWVVPGFHIRLIQGEEGNDADRVVALSPDDEEAPTITAPEPLPDDSPQRPEEMKPEPIELDIIDILKDDFTMAPGETSIVLPDPEVSEPADALPPEPTPLDVSKLLAGAPEANISIPDIAPITDNPVKINAQMEGDIDPDKWYEDQLKGNGGKDDSNLPGGNKTLNQLIALPSGALGKATGYSRLGADLLFQYDKAELKNTARISMLQLAALIHKNPKTFFIIEGHTDSFGSNEYNQWLSLQRANAVRLWLKNNSIPLDRVYIRACGNSKPVVSTNKDQAGQAANRRVEIHMRKQSEALPPDALPATHAVDTKRRPKTTEAKPSTPSPKPATTKPTPPPTIAKPKPPVVVAPIQKPKPTPKEEIPMATPVEDETEQIPAAIPVNEDPSQPNIPAPDSPIPPEAIPVPPDDYV